MNIQAKHNQGIYRLLTTHYLLAAACLVITAGMLLFAPESLSGHHFHPKLLAITHTAVLGWGTLIIFGACYQLIPVISESELYSVPLAWMGLFSFLPGLALLVYSFWIFDPGILMQLGSLLLLGGIILFVINLFQTSRDKAGGGTSGIHQEFIRTAGIWLIATAVVGVLMVFNFRYPFLPKDHLQFLRLHALMGLGGWFLLLVIGVSSKLLPMFLVTRVRKPHYLNYSFYWINLAILAFLADTYFSGLNWKTYVITGIGMAGIGFWLAFVLDCFRSRLKKRIEVPIWHTVLSFVLLALALVCIPVILLKTNTHLGQTFVKLYGTLLTMGWISSLIMGQTFKTLPFMTWSKHYHGQSGGKGTPMPADLYHPRQLKIQLALFLGFAATFYPGLAFGSAFMVRIGLFLFLLCSLIYTGNIMIILNHRAKRPL